MRILVCGGRDFADVNPGLTIGYIAKLIPDDSILKLLESIKQYCFGVGYLQSLKTEFGADVVWISGMARGADKLPFGARHSLEEKIQEFPADWKTHGKAAGFIRNQQMLDEGKPDLVVAFPGGRGTADMISRAKKAGVKVIEVKYDTI